ncbi:hypothetical protein KsCSTR_10770 [Candidatus Kuenenia stuttgartiensis]|uniref:Uncharacterized protein n=1 Tax=Kuenenia stuttgartiensis TaxID=174633 RepID=Q1PYM1_KUEST|nr:hypothetical protein KsCSTR_10770 [Candidatus Kuenenia stuttgartiensis]CAJ72184.1 unknown protein [Candidatus Kuenenia stuttgartiensis]
MFFSRKYKNPKNTDIKILRAYLKQVSAYDPLPTPTGRGFKDLMKHESRFSNIIGKSWFHSFFHAKLELLKQLRSQARSLGTSVFTFSKS